MEHHHDHPDESNSATGREEPSDVGVHGMLLFGESTIYLSHLPMFGPPHNFQVLIRATLSKEGADPAATYLEDRKASGAEMYTFVPEEFPISGLVGRFPDPPTVTSFGGTLVRGHFERGATPLVADVSVNVDDVVYFQELDPEARVVEGAQLEYLCFGQPGDLYLAHLITTRPSFDHVLTTTFLDPAFADQEFPRAAPVRLEGRGDAPDSRLQPNEAVSAFFFRSIGPEGRHGFTTDIRTGEDIYLEIDELA
jgi:hypothetical protein